MFEKIPAPVKGQPARASWGAGLTNRVNELGAMFPSRGLARDGLTGTGFAALPANRRERRTASLPWSFSCSEDADTHVRTGGWGNGLAQFGYDRLFVTPDLESVHRLNATTITGTDTTDDGFHYLEVDTLNATAEIKVDENGFPPHDPTRGILRIGLGLVEDGKLVSGFHHNPVIYKYV